MVCQGRAKREKLKITESTDKNGNKEKEMLIERNRMLTCFTKYELSEETIKVAKKIKKKYRVLATYTKQYNKWFMTKVKQRWCRIMKEEDLKKHRCAI